MTIFIIQKNTQTSSGIETKIICYEKTFDEAILSKSALDTQKFEQFKEYEKVKNSVPIWVKILENKNKISIEEQERLDKFYTQYNEAETNLIKKYGDFQNYNYEIVECQPGKVFFSSQQKK